jgi:hypothetical protein
MIETIYSLGDDALNNQFQMTIPSFPGVLDINATNLRVTEVTFPGYEVSTYTVDYKTQKFTKPAGKITTENSFDFTFRIDKYWKTYEGFEKWLGTILNPDTGVMSPDIDVPGAVSTIRVPITLVPVATDGTELKGGWDFTGCYPSAIDGVSFTQSDGTPLTVKVTMQYVKKIPRFA